MKRGLVFALGAGLTCAFIIDLCNLFYRCGCRSWWSGAAEACNVHMAGVKHCPWCTIGTGGFAAVVAGIVAAQAWLTFGFPSWRWTRRIVAVAAALPVAGALAAVVLGLWQGYWF